MNDPIVVYQEYNTLPLYNLQYNVIVGLTVKDILSHINMAHGFAEFNNLRQPGYTMMINNSEHGTKFFVLVVLNNIDKQSSIRRTVSHQAVTLSWEILHYLRLDPDIDNTTTQAFIIEELIEKLSECVENALEIIKPENNDNSFDDL